MKLKYLGSEHTCFLHGGNADTGIVEYWLEPYIDERKNRENGENIFLILTDKDKMTWHDFHYVVGRHNGVNQYKIYKEIAFKKIK